MRKVKIKLLSTALMVIILLNTLLPIANAVAAPSEENIELSEPYAITTAEEVIKTGVYLILGLEYEVYDGSQDPTNLGTPKTGKDYKANDYIKVKLRINEKQNFEKVVSFLYYIHYDKESLRLESLECGKTGYNDNSDLTYGYIAYQFGGSAENATIDDVVTEFIFRAKKDSDPANPTTITIYDCDFSDKNRSNAVDVSGNINTPQLTLPQEDTPVETITHGIEITKVDESNAPITMANAIYRITTPSGEEKLVQTNAGREVADGKLLLENLPMPSGAVDNLYQYTIEEVASPEGYVLDKTPKTLSVKFANDGSIREAKIGETAQTVNNNTVSLQFSNEKEQPKPVEDSKVTFVIRKKDERDQMITSSEASFGLEVATGDVRYVTTSSGTVTKSINVPEDISSPVEYKLNEISAPDGYVLDGQDIRFRVTYTKNPDNTVDVSSVDKIEGTNATISRLENTITIDVINEAIKVEEKFQIELTKVDEAGNPITNEATFLVTSPNGSSQVGQTSTVNGKMILQGNIPQGDLVPEGYTYKIQEIKAPSGYKLNQNEISVKLIFQDEGGVRKLASAQVVGENVTKQEILNNTLPLNIINQKEPENFTITLNKVNEAGNLIAQPNVYFKLTTPDGKMASLQTDATGKAIYTGKMPETEQELTYQLQEIVAPEGYVLNDHAQTITLNFGKVSGVMKLLNATVTDPISVVGDIVNNNLTINFKNEAEAPIVTKTDFDLFVTKIDKESGDPITHGSAIFELLNEDGSQVGLFETNDSGVATIKVDLPEEAKTVTYQLIEKVAPEGYVLDKNQKTLSVEFANESGEIVVRSIHVSGTNIREGVVNNTSASVMFENELIPPVEVPTTYELVINKKDAQDVTKNIEEENVLFMVTAPDGSSQILKTDALGKISIVGNMPTVAGTYTYEIEEMKAPTGYTLYGTTQYVDITFGDVDGVMQITSATVRGDKITKDFVGVNDTNDSQVVVSILNDKDIPEVDEKFTLNINKVDEELNNILQQNVSFKLETASENPQLVVTNANGVATFVGTIPKEEKTISYTLTELTQPDGYIKNENDMIVNLVFTNVSGTIKLTDITVDESQGVRKVGTVQDNIAEIKVINEKKLEQTNFTLEIHKQDETTKTNINEQGVGFEIVKPDGTNAYVETNPMGIAAFHGICPEEAGDYTYKVKEIKAPMGYIKNPNEMNVTLTFVEESGKIELGNVTVVVEEGIRKIGSVTENVAKVAVDNGIDPAAQVKANYALKINKVDEDETNILQAGVVFKVVDVLGNTSYIETNEQGIAMFSGEMPEREGTYTLKVLEISSPTGYIKNPNEMNIQTTFREVSGKMTLINVTVDETQQIKKVLTTQNDVIEVNVINESENPIEPVKENFTLGIKKVDAQTLAYIQEDGIIFKVEDSAAKYDFYGTNEQGIAKASFPMPDVAGTYTYYVQETVAPTGYSKNPNKIAVQATFVESNGKIVLEKFEVDAASGARVIENVTEGKIGYVEVLNNKIEEEPVRETWSMELHKVNSQTLEKIAQAGVVFKITDIEGKSNYLETDAEGKISLAYFMPETAGIARYEIEEIVAPNGYQLLEQSQSVEVTFGEVNGEIVITNAQVSGNKITNTYGTKKVTVSILNDVEQSIVDPEKETFDFVINKVDSENLQNILQSGVIFKVTDRENGGAYAETNEQGIATFQFNLPQTAGTYRYQLSEMVSPNGYKANEDDLYVDITFDTVDGTLKITDLSVNNENKMKEVKVEEFLAEIKVLNDKVTDEPTKPEDPDEPVEPGEPTKPTEPDKPVEPGKPSKPTEPDKPSNPVTPENAKFDAKTEKYLEKVVQTYTDTGETMTDSIARNKKVTKLDVKKDKIQYLQLELQYKIIVTNVGNKEGTITSIVDKIPKALQMNASQNKNWNLQGDIATYSFHNRVLKPGESAEVTITLHGNGKHLGTITNYAAFESIDEKDMSNVANSNNMAQATFILSVKTGQEWMIYTTLTLTSLGILALGIIAIKKYVL